MYLSGFAELKCIKCNNIFVIDGSDIYVEYQGSDERAMGPEEFFYGAIETLCPNCGNEIKYEHEASEYPIGALNYSEGNIEGAEFIKGFEDIDFYYEDEIYSYDKETNLYIPESQEAVLRLTTSVVSLVDKIILTPKTLFEINSTEFEELVAHIFYKSGFQVELTKHTRDGGRDIIALKSDMGIPIKYLIECKRYAINNKIGVGLVRNLFGVQQAEGANKSVLVTTSTFTKEAQEFANNKNTTEWMMTLKDYQDIYKWVINIPPK